MRTFGEQRGGPSWITALVIFLILIALMQLVGRGGPQSRALGEQFAASPPAADAGQIPLPPIPTDLVGLARTTTARLLGGQPGQPLNNVDQNESLRVEIDALEPQDGQLRVRGHVTNIGAEPLDLSLDVFKFVDETNTTYASSGSPSTTLPPSQRVPLDITLPLANPRLLQLRVTQPGLTPLELTLINTAPPPAP
jgi:hypothetical protein